MTSVGTVFVRARVVVGLADVGAHAVVAATISSLTLVAPAVGVASGGSALTAVSVDVVSAGSLVPTEGTGVAAVAVTVSGTISVSVIVAAGASVDGTVVVSSDFTVVTIALESSVVFLLAVTEVVLEADGADGSVSTAVVAVAVTMSVSGTVATVVAGVPELTVLSLGVVLVLKLEFVVEIGKVNLKIILDILVVHLGLDLELLVVVGHVELNVLLVIVVEATSVTVTIAVAVTDDAGGVANAATIAVATGSVGLAHSWGSSSVVARRTASSGAGHTTITGAGRSASHLGGSGGASGLISGVSVTVWVSPLSGGGGGDEEGESESFHFGFLRNVS